MLKFQLKNWWFAWPGLILLIILVRSINLLSLPLYLDEGLYIFWAKLFSGSSSFAYVSLQDGKTPLFIWLVSWMNSFSNNYLLTARLISVFGGVLTAICWSILLSKELGQKYAFIFLCLILILPFGFLIERMAFVDSLLTALGSISLLLFYLSYKRIRKDAWIFALSLAFLSGIFLGFAFLAKTSGKVFLAAQLMISLFWVSEFIKEKRLIRAGVLLICSIFLIILFNEILSYLKVGAYRFWGEIALKENQLTFSINDIISRGIRILDPNVHNIYLEHARLIINYFITYLGIVCLLFPIGCYWIFRKKRALSWMVFYTCSLIIAVLLSGKVMASRYLYIAMPGMVAIAACGLYWILGSKKTFKWAILGLLVILSLQSLKMVIDPLNAVYTDDDRSYFLTADLSALGLYDSANLIPEDSIMGISGVWGVAEGSKVVFEDFNFKAVIINKWLYKSDPVAGTCGENEKKVGEDCWRIDLGAIDSDKAKNKYLFLTRSTENVEILSKMQDISIENKYQRPGSSSAVYLVKLH